MNGIEFILVYKDLTTQVYKLWNNAIRNKDTVARQELDSLLEDNVERFVTNEYPREMYRARFL